MQPRRQFIASIATGTAVALATGLPPFGLTIVAAKERAEVSSNEDLMREHGVLRRALLVYTLCAAKIRKDPGSVPPDALKKTAMLSSIWRRLPRAKAGRTFHFPCR